MSETTETSETEWALQQVETELEYLGSIVGIMRHVARSQKPVLPSVWEKLADDVALGSGTASRNTGMML